MTYRQIPAKSWKEVFPKKGPEFQNLWWPSSHTGSLFHIALDSASFISGGSKGGMNVGGLKDP